MRDVAHVTSRTRPSPFSALKIWEWPGDEASNLHRMNNVIIILIVTYVVNDYA
jgi:hypothetical protein